VLPKPKPFIDARQLSLFPDYRDVCPLCGSASGLTTCRRLYAIQLACKTCAEGLRRYGWTILR
jgi:hypothetical protein